MSGYSPRVGLHIIEIAPLIANHDASPVASSEWLAGVVICGRLNAYCWVAVLLTWSL